MSRFVELLEAERDALDLDGLRGLFADMLVRLEAEQRPHRGALSRGS
jgi:GTP cyclohydrolase I